MTKLQREFEDTIASVKGKQDDGQPPLEQLVPLWTRCGITLTAEQRAFYDETIREAAEGPGAVH